MLGTSAIGPQLMHLCPMGSYRAPAARRLPKSSDAQANRFAAACFSGVISKTPTRVSVPQLGQHWLFWDTSDATQGANLVSPALGFRRTGSGFLLGTTVSAGAARESGRREPEKRSRAVCGQE